MNRLLHCVLITLALCLSGAGTVGLAQQPATTIVYGGNGGTEFADVDLPRGSRLMEVHVYTGKYVDAIQALYQLPDGSTWMGPRHGGPGGDRNVFRIDSDEFIVALSGRYGNYIDSMQIHTNKRSFPLLGGSGGSQSYRIDVGTENQAVGFTGRAGKYLDAVGLAFVPRTVSQVERTEFAGGRGGTEFADEEIPVGARISEVRIHSGSYVDSIQAIYTLQDGRQYEGSLHGGSGGKLQVFKLDADEYIVAISGRHGNYVDSLVIHTNKRRSPAYGGRGGNKEYRIDVPSGNRGIGFSGKSGKYLDAIGLTYAPYVATRQRGIRFRNRR